ncbi:MAG: class I SAM-dependent methyltransferase [Bacteroidales bacterium]|nr:class I SAM-dependent methyltransferase [Bacteroidales bacterium]
MKIPGNISYLLKTKENYKLPDIFNDYLLDQNFSLYSSAMVEEYRNILSKDTNSISIKDYGAGSKTIKTSERKISDIAKTSATRVQYGSLYQKIIDNYNLTSVLELGTSLGIGTMYFALASPEVKITTIEGCNNIYGFTKERFDSLGISNVKFINGIFDDLFDDAVLEPNKYDMFFIDGNHKSESVLKYYKYIVSNLAKEQAIIIIDDINWSSDMYNAWKQIKKGSENCFLIDLFRVGIVFKGFNYPSKKFVINFIK